MCGWKDLSHLTIRQSVVGIASVFMLPIMPLQASELSDAATSMQPGEWRELDTNNINETLTADGASNIVFGFTEDIKWDPVSRQLFYIGGDHNDAPQFISYSENTNSWQRLPRPSWMGTGTMHGYDHSAIDPQARYLYHRPYARSNFFRYQIDTGTWSTGSDVPQSVMGYKNCCVGVEWFPELGTVVLASVEASSNGALVQWEPASDQWSRITQAELPMGRAHHFAEYNPVHKVVIFGGGNDGGRLIYKGDANGNVVPLNQAPADLGTQESVVTVDPVSGDYLVFTSSGDFYAYNVLNDTWTLQSSGGTLPLFTTRFGTGVHGVVATPVASYNVNLFVTCDGGNNCKVNLYKHAPGAADVQPPSNPTNLQVN